MYSIYGHYTIKENMVPDINFDFTNESEKWKKQSDNQGGTESEIYSSTTEGGGIKKTEEKIEIVNIKKLSSEEITKENIQDITTREVSNSVIKKKTKQMKDKFSLSENSINPFNIFDSTINVSRFPFYLEDTKNINFHDYLGIYLTFKPSEFILGKTDFENLEEQKREMLINFPSGFNCGIILIDRKITPFIGMNFGENKESYTTFSNFKSFDYEVLKDISYRLYVEFDMSIPGETKILLSLKDLINGDNIFFREKHILPNLNISGYTTNDENIVVGQQVPWSNDAFLCGCNNFNGEVFDLKITRSSDMLNESQVEKLIANGESEVKNDFTPEQIYDYEISVGSINDSFGSFTIDSNLIVNKIEFNFTGGPGIYCNDGGIPSKFGCGNTMFGLILTDNINKEILPNKNVKKYLRLDVDGAHWYTIEGTDNSSYTMTWELEKPIDLMADTYKIWYSEDLSKNMVEDNGGYSNYNLKIFAYKNIKKSSCDIIKEIANQPSIPLNCVKVPIGFSEAGKIKCCKDGKMPVYEKFLKKNTAGYLENNKHEQITSQSIDECQKKCEEDESCLAYEFHKSGSCKLKKEWDEDREIFKFFRYTQDSLCNGDCSDWNSGIKFVHASTCDNVCEGYEETKEPTQPQEPIMPTENEEDNYEGSKAGTDQDDSLDSLKGSCSISEPCSLYGNPNLDKCDKCLDLYIKSLGLGCPGCGDQHVVAYLGDRNLFLEKELDYGVVGGRGFNIIILDLMFNVQNIAQFDTHGDKDASLLMTSWLDENVKDDYIIIFTIWDEAMANLNFEHKKKLYDKYGILASSDIENLLTTRNGNGLFEDKEKFNQQLKSLSLPFYIERTGNNYPNSHKKIIYKRLTSVDDVDMWSLFHTDWFNEAKGVKNKFNEDFKLYNNYEDAKSDKNAWKYCNFNDAGIGFPRDCGLSGYVPYTWMSKYKAPQDKDWNLKLYGDDSKLEYRSPFAAIVNYNSDKNKRKVTEVVHKPYTVPAEILINCFLPASFPVTIFNNKMQFPAMTQINRSLRKIKSVRSLNEIFIKIQAKKPNNNSEFNYLFNYGSNECCGGLVGGLKNGKIFLGNECNQNLVISDGELPNENVFISFYYNKKSKICKIWVNEDLYVDKTDITLNIPHGFLTIGTGCHDKDSHNWGSGNITNCDDFNNIDGTCFSNPSITSDLVKSTSKTIINSSYLTLSKSSLITSFDITENYKIDMIIHPTGKIGGWSNIIHSTIDGNNCCGPKSRLPGIWFFSNTTRLHIRTSTMEVGNFGLDPNVELPLNKDTRVIITVSGNKLRVQLSGGITYDNTIPISINRYSGRVKFYASDPWYNSSIAKIKDVKWTNIPSTGTINITSSHYGENCGVSKENGADNIIASNCDGKNTCYYNIDHNKIGDPSFGCAKQYKAQYSCGSGPSRIVSANSEASGRQIFLDCSDVNSNITDCGSNNCGAIHEYCKKQNSHLATKEELKKWLDNGNTPPQPYGVTSTKQDDKIWIEGKDWDMDGCCDATDRYFICSRSQEDIINFTKCAEQDYMCKMEKEKFNLMGHLNPPPSNIWEDGYIASFEIYDKFFDENGDTQSPNEVIQMKPDNAKSNFENDVKCEDLCDLGIKGNKDDSWLCSSSKPLSDFRCCKVEDDQWCPTAFSSVNSDIGNITLKPSGSNRCCCGTVLVDEDIESNEATREERILSTDASYNLIREEEDIYRKTVSKNEVVIGGDPDKFTTTITTKSIKRMPVDTEEDLQNEDIYKQLLDNNNTLNSNTSTKKPTQKSQEPSSTPPPPPPNNESGGGLTYKFFIILVLVLLIILLFIKK